jgi:hypothetical protein
MTIRKLGTDDPGKSSDREIDLLDVMDSILLELKIANAHLSAISGMNYSNEDLDDADS